MINIQINLNNVENTVDLQALAQEISGTLERYTGQNAHVNLNVRDDHSMSPLGIHKTQEYMKLRGRI